MKEGRGLSLAYVKTIKSDVNDTTNINIFLISLFYYVDPNNKLDTAIGGSD